MTDLSSSPCPCSDPQDPRVVSNPPGQPYISYRVDDFTGFRRALLRSLPGERSIGNWQGGTDQGLSNWRPAPGDLGLQVLEWWAYLADVLTFYNERIANESYLRTAQLPASVANLVALIGYEPAPGLAATGQVAAVCSTGKPGQELLVPAGMRLASAAANGVPSQIFEVSTTSTTTITPPSAIPVTLEPDDSLQLAGGASASVLLQGTVSGVKAGDRLLLAPVAWDGGNDSWSWVSVASVSPSPDPATGARNTLVEFDTTDQPYGWGPQPPPTASQVDAMARIEYDKLLEKRGGGGGGGTGLEHHTYLPPDTVGPASDLTTDYRLLKPTATAALWSADLTTDQPAVTDYGGEVHLSASVRGITPGDIVLFDTGATSAAAAALVTGTTDVLYTVKYPASVTGVTPDVVIVTHTELTLGTPTDSAAVLTAAASTAAGAASVAVRYAFKDVGTVIALPQTQLTSLETTGVQVLVPTSYVVPAAGATAFLVDSTGQGVRVGVTGLGTWPASGTPTANVVTLAPTGTPPSQITVGSPLIPPLQLLVDLLPVSRGQTVSNEVLGSGNAALANQSFTLAKSPLTYLASGTSWVSTLSVYVGGPSGILWSEVDTFYDQAPDARVYTVSRSADQSVTTVTFGDGVNGARLPTGSGNVVATYRFGSGAASPPAGALTTIVQPQPLLASISNPVAVLPGKDPEQPADVKANAPASVFTFGRAISAIDYEVVASQAPGVSRVSAVWTFDGTEQRTLVAVYVGDDAAAVTSATNALAGSEDPNRPVSVQLAAPIAVSLSCTLVVASDREPAPVVAAATSAVADPVAGLFSPQQMAIGQRLYRSTVDAALSVPGVLAVHDLEVKYEVVWQWEYFELTFVRTLDEVIDPGEGSYFTLSGPPTIGWVQP